MQSSQKAIIRHPAPEFSGQAWWKNKFQKVSLNDFKGKYVVLFFWPLDFTFVCPTEICQYSDKNAEFEKIGCQIIGCSIDSHFTHMEYTKKDRKKGGLGPMAIPMLSDITHQISKDYGCLIEDGGDAGIAFRATYIIDDKGVLRHISISDFPVGRNVEETLRLVKAFQYSDEHGEVCPAQWTPGKATMKPTHDAQLT